MDVGDRVFKHSGDYQLYGEIRSIFTTKVGKTRYVVEHDGGFLHIYSDANIRLQWKVYSVLDVSIGIFNPGVLNWAPGFFFVHMIFSQNIFISTEIFLWSTIFLGDTFLEHSLRSPKVKGHNPLLCLITAADGRKACLIKGLATQPMSVAMHNRNTSSHYRERIAAMSYIICISLH